MQRGQGFRIGRLFGIDIRVDWSWLIIFALVTYSLGFMLAELQVDWEPELRWGVAATSSLLFFASVLAHELSHSLVSQAFGNPVDSITLFLFGGVAEIREEPETPLGEFLMALVGPVSSLVIGGALLVLSGVLAGPVAVVGDPAEIIPQLGPLSLIALWVGSVNIVLAAFNMLPGFPLDGGRVLRSILWAVTGNLRSATRWATWVGQGFGWLMIAGGISMVFGMTIPFFGTGLINGLWLAFIGWFLNNAAQQSYRRVVVQDILEGVPVTRMMRENPPTASPTESVESLVYERIMGTDEHAFPVLDQGELVGIVTLQDVRSVPRERWTRTQVREIMTPHKECALLSSDRDAAEAMTKLATCDVHELPIMENGNLKGVLRRQDLIQWLRLHAETGGWGPREGIG